MKGEMRAAWQSPVLAQRAASEGSRWMPAVRRLLGRPLKKGRGKGMGWARLDKCEQEISTPPPSCGRSNEDDPHSGVEALKNVCLAV